jgi:hypothetical protein
MTLTDIIDTIQSAVAAVEGIRYAPDAPPESVSVFPFVTTYPASGGWAPETFDGGKSEHQVVCELHIARKDLPRNISEALGYADTIPAVIWALFGGDTSVTATRYDFTAMEWGGVETIGFRWTVSVETRA